MLHQLATIDPLIDEEDRARGYVSMDHLRAYDVQGEGWFICTIDYSTLTEMSWIADCLPVRT